MDNPVQSISTETLKSKPGPKAKEKVDINALQARVDTLEEVIKQIALHTGNRAILVNNDLTPPVPNIKRKYG